MLSRELPDVAELWECQRLQLVGYQQSSSNLPQPKSCDLDCAQVHLTQHPRTTSCTSSSTTASSNSIISISYSSTNTTSSSSSRSRISSNSSRISSNSSSSTIGNSSSSTISNSTSSTSSSSASSSIVSLLTPLPKTARTVRRSPRRWDIAVV
ncbi:hypothetical protein FHG87_001250 [Trinorchestia longiramus]|nr:hypothetical protein FHG87_001250 [Trinorchestia longiramus]